MLGAASCFAASTIRSRWNIDDALDVSSVHGVTGILGSLYIGFCFTNGWCLLLRLLRSLL
jgi:Amt family ammonium transporter